MKKLILLLLLIPLALCCSSFKSGLTIVWIRGSWIAPAYNASKAYQINYLEGLRLKVAKTKNPIYVTDIRPGFVDKDMTKGEGQFWVATKEKAAWQIFGIIKIRKVLDMLRKDGGLLPYYWD